jgi:hypothetical protein
MAGSNYQCRALRALLLGLGAALAIGVTGCQSEIGGQVLPSPFYMTNQVQYYQPGPQMKLSQEAAAQKAYNQEEAARQQ